MPRRVLLLAGLHTVREQFAQLVAARIDTHLALRIAQDPKAHLTAQGFQLVGRERNTTQRAIGAQHNRVPAGAQLLDTNGGTPLNEKGVVVGIERVLQLAKAQTMRREQAGHWCVCTQARTCHCGRGFSIRPRACLCCGLRCCFGIGFRIRFVRSGRDCRSYQYRKNAQQPPSIIYMSYNLHGLVPNSPQRYKKVGNCATG